MEKRIKECKKLTNTKWANLFEAKFLSKKKELISWFFVSRKDDPINDKSSDFVVVVPFVFNQERKKIVLIKEYRVTADGYIWSFPMGLIDKNISIEENAKKELKEETGLNLKKMILQDGPFYASPGLTDERGYIVYVEAEGEISKKYQEDIEDIQAFMYDRNDIDEKMVYLHEAMDIKSYLILEKILKTSRFHLIEF